MYNSTLNFSTIHVIFICLKWEFISECHLYMYPECLLSTTKIQNNVLLTTAIIWYNYDQMQVLSWVVYICWFSISNWILLKRDFNFHVFFFFPIIILLFLSLACMAGTWKWWVQERTGRMRETHEGGLGSTCPRGPRKSFVAPSPITWQPLHDLSKIFDRKQLTLHKQSVPKCTFISLVYLM